MARRAPRGVPRTPLDPTTRRTLGNRSSGRQEVIEQASLDHAWHYLRRDGRPASWDVVHNLTDVVLTHVAGSLDGATACTADPRWQVFAAGEILRQLVRRGANPPAPCGRSHCESHRRCRAALALAATPAGELAAAA